MARVVAVFGANDILASRDHGYADRTAQHGNHEVCTLYIVLSWMGAVIIFVFGDSINPAKVIVRFYVVNSLGWETGNMMAAAGHVIVYALCVAIAAYVFWYKVAIAVIPEGIAGVL